MTPRIPNPAPSSLPRAAAAGPRRRAVLGMLAGVPLLAACGGGGDPLAASSSAAGGASTSAAGSASGAASGTTVTVGSANFPEAEIIGELYAQVLEAKGVSVDRKMQIGAREVYLGALEDGSVDLLAEYTGNLLGYYDKQATATTEGDVRTALEKALPEGLTVLDSASAQDKDSYNVTQEFSEKNSITSMADLADYAGTLRIGGQPELSQIEYGAGLPVIERVYGVPRDKMDFTPISDGGGPLTVRALKNGDVDLANIFSTTPAIKDEGFVTLEDPKNMITAQNVVPLMRTPALTDQIRDAVNAVQAKLTTEDLLAMNAANAGAEKKQPKQVAQEWLKEKGLV